MTKWSTSVEDYLKQIYLLQQGLPAGKSVQGQALARRLQVSHASVTGMLKKLAEAGLIHYESRQGVTLLEPGEEIALELVRHHRLLELYLTEVLGMSWDEVHDEAEILEHHISERVEALMAAKLGNPQFDPHGHPIPSVELKMPKREANMQPLSFLAEGERAIVRMIRHDSTELLQYLAEIGIVPDRELSMMKRAPLDGPVTILNHAGEQHALNLTVAEQIDVSA